MPDNSMHIYTLRYRSLLDHEVSWFEVKKTVDYFITHEAEQQQVGDNILADALFDLALHKDSLVRQEAIVGLLQLGCWEELGWLACIWIDPNKELKRHILAQGYHFVFPCYCDPDAIKPLGWDLAHKLQKPVNTDPLWPAVRKFFRRKDEGVLRRALYVVRSLHIAKAIPTLKRLIEDPEKAALHSDAVLALGGIGDARALRYLVQLLDKPEYQFDVLYALQIAASPETVRALKQLLLTSPSPKLQLEIIAALGKSGGDAAARVLLKHVEAPYTRQVIMALGEAGSDVAVPRLKRFLCSRNSTDEERELAAEALSEIDSVGSRRVLAETLSGSNKKAASYAGAALRSRKRGWT